MTLTLHLDAEGERLVWRNAEGLVVRSVSVPDVRWSVCPEALRGVGTDGAEWEAGTAVAAPVGWLIGEGVVRECVGGGPPQVLAEQARRRRDADARRAADGTLVVPATGLATLLEWAKLAVARGADDPIPSARADEAEWLRWWATRPCRAQVPREAYDRCLHSVLGLTRATTECEWDLRLPPGWSGWRLDRWRVGSATINLALDLRPDGLALRLRRRHGPAILVTIRPPEGHDGLLTIDGESVGARRARWELQEEVVVRWITA